MVVILGWAVVALVMGFSDGYVYRNEPNILLSALGVVALMVLENLRWCMANDVPLHRARKDPRWDRHAKIFVAVVWLMLVIGSFLGYKFSV